MSVIVEGDCYEVRVKGRLGEKDADNVLHYRATAAPGAVDLIEFADAFRLSWIAEVMALVNEHYELQEVKALHIQGLFPTLTAAPFPYEWGYDEQVISPVAPATVGAATGECMPNFNAFGAQKVCDAVVLIDGSTPIPSAPLPRITGSIRIAGVTESNTTAAAGINTIDPAVLTTLHDNLLDMRQFSLDAGAAILDMVVLSSRRNKVIWDPPLALPFIQFGYAVVRDFNMNPYVTSQVSRKQKR